MAKSRTEACPKENLGHNVRVYPILLMRVIFQIVFLLLFVQLVWGKILEVGEGEMPELSNESSAFRGKILSEEYLGHTWVTYPHVELSLIHI